MIWLARSRASRTITSALSRAEASSFSPSSAAASPCAIFRSRSFIGPRIIGQTNFIVNQMSRMNTIICTTRVRLMFTVPLRYRSCPPRQSMVERTEKRIREGEEQREPDADHRHRVEQPRDHEHLDAQHRQQLGLTGRSFDEASAQYAETDGGAGGAQAEDDADPQNGHGLHLCDVHSDLLVSDARWPAPGTRSSIP